MAFPGWRAEEIQLALTEDPLSGKAWRALERVALAMGAREGTGPENDPLMRSVSGRQRREVMPGVMRGATWKPFGGRGHGTSGTEASKFTRTAFTEDRQLFAAHPIEALMAAALVCTDEADFRRRLRDTA